LIDLAGLKDSLEGAAKQKKKETENEKLTPWEQYQKSKKDKKRQKEREKKRKVSSVFETLFSIMIFRAKGKLCNIRIGIF